MSRPVQAAVLTLLALTIPISAQDGWTTFTFSKMNTTFERTEADVTWSSDGPVAIRMTSPQHRLQVVDHRLELRPLGDGTYESRTWVHFEGEGDIEAKVDALGSAGDFSDHVVIPRQEVEVDSKLRLVPLDNGNVEVIAVELPSSIGVEIESGLGRQLYTICNLTLAILAGADCSLVEGAFTSARVPMPEPGTATVLTPEQMTSVEAVHLHAWVTATQTVAE